MLRQDHSCPILFFGFVGWGLLPILRIFSDMPRMRVLLVVRLTIIGMAGWVAEAGIQVPVERQIVMIRTYWIATTNSMKTEPSDLIALFGRVSEAVWLD
jgi:hypothetical protein